MPAEGSPFYAKGIDGQAGMLRSFAALGKLVEKNLSGSALGLALVSGQAGRRWGPESGAEDTLDLMRGAMRCSQHSGAFGRRISLVVRVFVGFPSEYLL